MMNKFQKKVLLFLPIFLFSLFLVGCDRDQDYEDVTITVAWWGGDMRTNMTIEVIELFMEEFPHITVEYVFAGWDEYWTFLNTRAAGDILPDVIQMDMSRINEYVDNNLIISLDDFIASGLIDMSDVEPVFQESVKVDGENMAISLGANAWAMLYNVDMARELGIEFTPDLTWDSFKAILTDARVQLGDEFFGWAGGAYELLMMYVRDSGYPVYVEGGLGYSRELLLEYFEMLMDFQDNNIAWSPDIEAGLQEGVEPVDSGYILASMIPSTQIIGRQRQSRSELGLALLPRIDGGRGADFIRSSMGFSISSQSREQEAAAEFINFFINSVEANEIMIAERGVPVATTVREHLRGIVDPEVIHTFDILDLVAAHASPVEPIPPAGQVEIRTAVERVVEQLRFGVMTPVEAVDYVFDIADRALR